MEQGSLWHSIILSRYGYDENGWVCNRTLPRSRSLCWHHNNQVSLLFYPQSRFLLGNGLNIHFWKDLWWGESTLELAYLGIFRSGRFKEAKVAEVLSQRSYGIELKPSFC